MFFAVAVLVFECVRECDFVCVCVCVCVCLRDITAVVTDTLFTGATVTSVPDRIVHSG